MSGRNRYVAFSASFLRHRAMSWWFPLRSTSGTSIPSNTTGRVYWGYSKRPLEKESSSALASLPSTPGTKRLTASMIIRAGSSPPVRTKSPMLIFMSTQ